MRSSPMALLCWSCENRIPERRVREQEIHRTRSLLGKTLPGARGTMGYGVCPTCRQRFYLFYNRAGEAWVQPDMIPQVEDAFPPRAGTATELRKRAWMRHREGEMRAFFTSPGRGRRTETGKARRRPAKGDPYRLLGVDRKASKREVDRAFRQMAKRCHPDRVAQLDREIQELAHRKFLELKMAYDAAIQEISTGGSGRRGHERGGRKG